MPVDAGEHTIEFRFTTAGYPLAIFISIAGLALFAGMIFIHIRFFRGRYTDEFDDDVHGNTDGGSDDNGSGGDSGNGGSGGDDDYDDGEEDYEVDEYDSDLLDIFHPRGKGSEWI